MIWFVAPNLYPRARTDDPPADAPRHGLLPRFGRWMALRDTPADVAVEQVRELSRHMPALYVVMIGNVLMLSYAISRSTAIWIAAICPVLALALAVNRLVWWHRLRQRDHVEPASAIAVLRGAIKLTVVLAIAEVGGSLIAAIVDTADLPMIAVTVVITVVGCIFCLMHLPQAAVLVAPCALIPWIGYCLWIDNREMAGVLIQVALVMVLMLRVLGRSFQTFTALLRSRTALAEGRCEAERLSEQNARIANMDGLTGLPNRRYFFAHLDALVAERGGADDAASFAVGLFDLDRFKPVNDTYGHAIGDRLLGDVGDRLRAASDGDMVIARLGGDEFGILLANHADPAAVVRHICDVVVRPFRVDDLVVAIGCSAGVAVFPDAGRSGRELLDRADYALYHSKSTMRGGVTIFSAEHERRIRSGQILEAALQTADLEREIALVYQPILDTHHMTVVGVEALARWHSPILGNVSPDQFIPVAENLGTIGGLTLILLRKALADAATFPAEIGLSFNLSANDVGAPATVEAVIATILASRFDPRRITFEITETAMMRDFDIAVEAIERLRALGIKMALDDFGTGFSSLTHLRRLPIDRVKIDRSFAAGLHEESGHKIVAAIGGLCRNLGLDCVIEGIEEEHQFLRIRQFGYRLAQGYLLARPMPVDALLAWLAREEVTDQRTA